MLGYRNVEASTTMRSQSNQKMLSDKDDKYMTRGCAAAGLVDKPKVSSLDGGGGGFCSSGVPMVVVVVGVVVVKATWFHHRKFERDMMK